MNLANYPNKTDARYLLSGFQTGFRLQYYGPRMPIRSNNLLSARQERSILHSKLYEDLFFGRLSGPFPYPPISNLRINPVGLVPKSTGGWRLITNLSFPEGHSVNDYVDQTYCRVQYSKFDDAVNIIQRLGPSAYMAKADIKSAFNLCPIWPGDFDLLGIKTDDGYWIQKMLPMGASCSCYIFEKFATFVQWLVAKKASSSNIVHLLDDFFMAGCSFVDCLNFVEKFESISFELGIPLSEEKKIGPVTKLTFLGLELDSVNQTISIPREKVLKARDRLISLVNSKKIKLKYLQCSTLSAKRFQRGALLIVGSMTSSHRHLNLIIISG